MTVMGLPEKWDFSVRGIISILPDGRDAIYAMIEILMRHGYCTREKTREGGKFDGYDYHFWEEPKEVSPFTENPDTVTPCTEKPDTVLPDTEKPCTENPTQYKSLKESKESKEDKEDKELAPPKKPSEIRREVFDHYCAVTGHADAIFTAKRQTMLRKLMDEGYTGERLKNAASGYMLSPHHTGQNETGTIYDKFEMIFRDGEKVEQGEGYYRRPPRGRRRLETFPTHGNDVVFESIEQVEIDRGPAPELPIWQQTFFERVLEFCQAKLNPDVYQTWFGPLICEGVDKATQIISLRAPKFNVDWLKMYYPELLAEALGEYKICWIKDEGEDEG